MLGGGGREAEVDAGRWRLGGPGGREWRRRTKSERRAWCTCSVMVDKSVALPAVPTSQSSECVPFVGAARALSEIASACRAS
eukprot:8679590-Pyramimonas_sp.AAC.1